MKPIAILFLSALVTLGCSKSNPTAPLPLGATTRYSYTSGSVSLRGIQVHFVGTNGMRNDTLGCDIAVKDSIGPITLFQDTLSLSYSSDSIYDKDVTLRRRSAVTFKLDTIKKLILYLRANSGSITSSYSSFSNILDSLNVTSIPYTVTDTSLQATLGAAALRSTALAFDRHTESWQKGNPRSPVQFVDAILGYQDTASLVISLRQ